MHCSGIVGYQHFARFQHPAQTGQIRASKQIQIGSLRFCRVFFTQFQFAARAQKHRHKAEIPPEHSPQPGKKRGGPAAAVVARPQLKPHKPFHLLSTPARGGFLRSRAHLFFHFSPRICRSPKQAVARPHRSKAANLAKHVHQIAGRIFTLAAGSLQICSPGIGVVHKAELVHPEPEKRHARFAFAALCKIAHKHARAQGGGEVHYQLGPEIPLHFPAPGVKRAQSLHPVSINVL